MAPYVGHYSTMLRPWTFLLSAYINTSGFVSLPTGPQYQSRGLYISLSKNDDDNDDNNKPAKIQALEGPTNEN